MNNSFAVVFLTAFLFLAAEETRAQTTQTHERSFTIRADGNAFMCPFLSPMFIKNLERTGYCKVWKTQDLIIHVRCEKESSLTNEKILEIAEKTGYAKELLHFEKE